MSVEFAVYGWVEVQDDEDDGASTAMGLSQQVLYLGYQDMYTDMRATEGTAPVSKRT
jgi:hypothetical protein